MSSLSQFYKVKKVHTWWPKPPFWLHLLLINRLHLLEGGRELVWSSGSGTRLRMVSLGRTKVHVRMHPCYVIVQSCKLWAGSKGTTPFGMGREPQNFSISKHSSDTGTFWFWKFSFGISIPYIQQVTQLDFEPQKCRDKLFWSRIIFATCV